MRLTTPGTTLQRMAAALGISSAEMVTYAAPGGGGGTGQASALRLEVLGPLAVSRGGKAIPIGGDRHRTVLGLMALRAGESVSLSAVGEVLWEGEPPPSGTAIIQTQVSWLRAALGTGRTAEVGQEVIETVGGGYRLCLDDGALDTREFRWLGCEAREALRAGDADTACGAFEAALGLWRGEPLADVPLLAGHPTIVALVEEHAGLVVAYAETASALGRHDRALPHLFPLIERCPLDERAHAALMIALAGSGRQAAALEVFEQLRRRLDDQLGVQPCPALTDAHARVLRQQIPVPSADRAPTAADVSPPAAAPSTVTAPAQLPLAVPDFTGRGDQVAQVSSWLESAADRTTVPVVVVSGPPGVGKTALALQVAHAVREHFTDGQLWASLDGASARPRDPGEVLGEWLRALGVAGSAIPEGREERAALFRSRLADQNMLVVADDAGSAAAVASLLPGTAGCAVLVTSRRQLTDLPGGRYLQLGPMPAEQASELLSQVAGAERIAADADAAAMLMAACGWLPLAVRIAGAKLAARPSVPVSVLAGSLAQERQRLDVLRVGDLSVRASIASGYEALSEPARRAFCLLSLLGPCDVAEWVIAALLGEPDASAVADELVDRSMLTVLGVDDTGQPRYRLHDLLRDYAAEQAATMPQADRTAALERAHHGWLQLAALASDRLPPVMFFPQRTPFAIPHAVPSGVAKSLVAAPEAWFRSERSNLIIATKSACVAGRYELAGHLAECQAGTQDALERYDDAIKNWQLVAACSAENGDVLAVARAQFRVVAVSMEVGSPADLQEVIDECIHTFEEFEDFETLAFSLYWRGAYASFYEKYQIARGDQERGVLVARKIGNAYAEWACLRQLGLALASCGDYEQGIRACDEALRIAGVLRDKSFIGQALQSLAVVCVYAGENERAIELCARRRELCKEMGDANGAGLAWGVTGDAYYGLSRYDKAVSAYLQVLPIVRECALYRYLAMCLYKLGCAHHAMGNFDEAACYLQESASIFRDIRMFTREQRAREALGACYAPRSGDVGRMLMPVLSPTSPQSAI